MKVKELIMDKYYNMEKELESWEHKLSRLHELEAPDCIVTSTKKRIEILKSGDTDAFLNAIMIGDLEVLELEVFEYAEFNAGENTFLRDGLIIAIVGDQYETIFYPSAECGPYIKRGRR